MKFEIKQGDALTVLKTMPSESVHCCVTSPPYWGLRDYGVPGQVGLEPTPAEYISVMRAIFAEVRRVLRSDGTLWLNMGDCYHQGNKGQSGEMAPNYKQATNRGSLTTRRGEMLGSNRNRNQEGMKPKDLVGMPWEIAFALRSDGWYLRQDIIWSKPNPMPESVTDRCTKAHEYLFLLSKSARYYYDQDAIAEEAGWRDSNFTDERDLLLHPNIGLNRKPLRSDIESRHRSEIEGGQSLQAYPNGTRNRRSVWEVATQPYSEAHFATFPPKLIEPCILAGCPEGKTVLDPFAGAGTTGLVATRLQRNAILIELNPTYCEMMRNRITQDAPLFHAGAYASSSGPAESGQGLTDGQEKV